MTHLNRELRPILLLCLLVLMPIITPGVTANEAADAIEAEGGKWAHYYENEDLEGLMTLYVDDVVVALHGQPVFELDYEVRETHGNIAYIISKYWLKAIDKSTGAIYREVGRSLLVYKMHEGRWKIAADIDQSTPDVDWPAPSGLE